jgi:SAM-dependent methyltransferase
MATFSGWYGALHQGDSAYNRAVAEARGADAALEQQGFLSADAILALAESVGVGPAARVLDVCCGTGGPAALLAERFGARVVGVDLAVPGLQRASGRAALHGRCVAGDATRLPFRAAAFGAAVLYDSLMSIVDKAAVAREVARVLVPGGRFACTDLFGEPLSTAEQARLPADAPAYVITPETWLGLLRATGLECLQTDDHSAPAAAVAGALAAAFERQQAALQRELGVGQARDLITTTTLWAGLLATRRVALLAFVTERLERAGPGPGAAPLAVAHR